MGGEVQYYLPPPCVVAVQTSQTTQKIQRLESSTQMEEDFTTCSSRNWVFTYFYQTVEELTAAETKLQALPHRYVVWGRETCPTTGRAHLQGQICFANTKAFAPLKKIMPHASRLAPTKDLFASIDYCKKGGDFYEFGTKPLSQTERGKKGGDLEKERWVHTLAAAKEGRFDEIDPQLQVTQCRNLEYIHQRALAADKPADSTERHQWYYGATGTGKSRKARTDHPDAYLKMCNKWWDHYANEPTVLIEDFDKKHDVLCHHLKIWADRYPFLAEIKNGTRKVRPNLIIITSNYHPCEIWSDPADLEPILRRFHVTEFENFPTHRLHLI